MLENNPWLKEETTKKMIKYLRLNPPPKPTTFQNFNYIAKIFWRKFIP